MSTYKADTCDIKEDINKIETPKVQMVSVPMTERISMYYYGDDGYTSGIEHGDIIEFETSTLEEQIAFVDQMQ